MKKIVKNYRTYKLTAYTAYAAGKTYYRHPSNKTIDFLRRQGIREIIWADGAFISL